MVHGMKVANPYALISTPKSPISSNKISSSCVTRPTLYITLFWFGFILFWMHYIASWTLGCLWVKFMSGKVVVPTSNTTIIWTPIVEWYVVRCVSKNGQQKERCVNEIGLHAQNMLIILGLIVNMIKGDPYNHLMNTQIITLKMNEMFIWAPWIMRQMATDTIWIRWLSHTNCVFHILRKVVQREKCPNNTHLTCKLGIFASTYLHILPYSN